MKARKVYEREFKANAIKFSNERDNLSQLARELEISEKQLYSWRSAYIWYRKQRRHSYPGYQTIEEFNLQHQKTNMNNVA